MINPAKLLKIKNAWDVFTQNHPKFPKFLEAVNKSSIEEGTIIEVTVTDVSGKKLSSNFKLKQTDVELFHELSESFKS